MANLTSKLLFIYTQIYLFSIHFISADPVGPYFRPDDDAILHPADRGFCYTDPECTPDTKAWSELCRKGKSQSPIKLDWPDYIQPNRVPVQIQGFRASKFTITNNGHSVVAHSDVDGDDIRGTFFPGGGLLEKPYKFSGLHLHWGKNDLEGTEHIIDSQPYSMEAHFVHYSAEFPDIIKAVESGKKDALAVAAFVFETVDGDNGFLAPIANNLFKIVEPGYEDVHEELDFASVIPQSGDKFFSYNGSMTAPGCYENVKWFVFRTPLPVSSAQLAKFREIEDHRGHLLLMNHRPLNKLNNRVVLFNEIA